MGTLFPLTAYSVHGPYVPDVDLVLHEARDPLELLQERPPHGPFYLLVRRPSAKQALEVVLGDAEEAGHHVTVRLQAYPVAVSAEGLGHRGDGAYPALRSVP